MTYMVEEKICSLATRLVPTAAWTAFCSTTKLITTDILSEALRYYTNIVAAYSKNVLQAIDKISAYPVEILAPSHGLGVAKGRAHHLAL